MALNKKDIATVVLAAGAAFSAQAQTQSANTQADVKR